MSQNDQNNNQNNVDPASFGKNYPSEPQQAPAPTPEPIPAPAPAGKKKSKKPLFITIIAVVLVIALAVGGFFGYKALFGGKKGDKEVVITNENLAEIDDSEVTVLELYPDREVSEKDLEEFAELIEERISILGDNYEIQTDDEKITLIMQKSLLGNTAMERTSTVELLVSRGNIGFGLDEYADYNSPTKDDITEITVVELDRADFLNDYRADIDEERYAQLEKIDSDTIYGLNLTLNGSGGNNIKDITKYAYSTPKLSITHDYVEETYSDSYNFFGSVVTIKNDEKDLYVVSQGASYEKNAQLMKAVLEGGEMDFSLVIQIADEPNWETDADDMGENQVESMDGDTITIQAVPDKYTLSYNSEVDFAEYESTLKGRMDALNIDYMFGTSGFDDKTYCICVDPEEFAPDFSRLIFYSESVQVRSSFGSVSSIYDPEIIETEDGYGLRLTSYYSLEEILEENDIPGNTVYLVANDVTIASADITTLQEDENGYYSLDFTHFLCFDDPVAGEEEKNVLDLICYIDDNYSYFYFEGSFLFRTSDDEEHTYLNEIEWKYSSLSDQDEQVFDILTSSGYTAEKKVDARNVLYITIDLPVDENLPATFLEKVKEIYNLCSFDGGAYNEIYFVIKDETLESPANQFRVYTIKDTFDKKMIFYRNINGPKFSEYWSEVYDLMEEDPFFIERSY